LGVEKDKRYGQLETPKNYQINPLVSVAMRRQEHCVTSSANCSGLQGISGMARCDLQALAMTGQNARSAGGAIKGVSWVNKGTGGRWPGGPRWYYVSTQGTMNKIYLSQKYLT